MSEQPPPQQGPVDAPLLNAGDVARILGVPKTWVYAETRAGRLPHVNVGRYRRYRRSTLDAWIADRERGPIGAGPTADRTRRRRTSGFGDGHPAG